MGIVFVAGIHAVGKTTACQQVAHDCHVPHYSASAVIKAEKESAIAKKGKMVADVDGNQKLLVQGVNRVLSQHEGVILLDGHFTLLNSKGEIQSIESVLFQQISLDRVIVFRDDPDAIVSRMANRDGNAYTRDLIDRHQTKEITHAKIICEELAIPFQLLDAFDSGGLKAAIGR